MSTIQLVQIINATDVEGTFTNRQTAADSARLPADAPTNTPGHRGDGCPIPDCGAGRWWHTHRMTVTLDGAILSVWKEGRTVYYRQDQSVYPGEGGGSFLWEDNGLPVALRVVRDAPPTMTNP